MGNKYLKIIYMTYKMTKITDSVTDGNKYNDYETVIIGCMEN